MVYFSIIFFFVLIYVLGFTATGFVRNSENFLERNLMRIGTGLSMLPLIGLMLNLLHIPIDWRIILALGMIYPAYCLIKNKSKPSFNIRITKTDLSIIIMLALFFANLYIYASGAFAYPYLEDDDSWSHAMGVKYVAVEKKAFTESRIFHYLSPYPPAYDLLLGIIHQTNGSIYFTLKFFNALIISMSTIFFYFFVKEFTQSRNKALFAAFALLSIPAFMSHFIWALSIAVPLYFVSFYALEMIRHDPKWFIVAGLSMVTVFTSSPTHSAYFGLFLGLYVLAKIALERKFMWRHIAASLIGVLLSFGVWWLPMIMQFGFEGTLTGIGFNIGVYKELGSAAFRGTGDRAYTFSDFFFAKEQNMINNPIGIGVMLSILALIGIIFMLIKFKHLLKPENHWMAITFIWFLLAFYAVNGARFSIKLSPFRAWMLLAIPVCILAAEGALSLMSLSRHFTGNIGKYAVLALLIALVFFTSTRQKIAVNTSPGWPPGGFWTSPDEISGYTWMRDNLPKNTKIFTFTNNAAVIGNDMYTCHWCNEVREYQKIGFNKTAEENYQWLKENEYSFIIIDGQTANKFGPETTNNKIQAYVQTGKFIPQNQNRGMILFKV